MGRKSTKRLHRQGADDRLSRWPVSPRRIDHLGQSVMADRGNGQPHYGLDIYVPSEAGVYAPISGRVVRVIDGRKSPEVHRRRAGLWIDLRGKDGLLYRFLHLGQAFVESDEKVRVGERIACVADEHTSGLGESGPHLHFEIRREPDKAYGPAIDPLTRLPPRRHEAVS